MPAPDPHNPHASPSPKTFEQSVDQIEEIVAKIESGELGLEDSIAAYERAAALLKACRGELAKAEQKVTELSKAMAEASKQSPTASV